MIQRGVTLIEGLITLVILLVGIMGFLGSFTYTLRQATASKNDSQALFMATSFIDELKSQSYETWTSAGVSALVQEFNADFDGARVDEGSYYELNATIDRVQDGTAVYHYVTVTVGWATAADEQREGGFLVEEKANGNDVFVMEAIVADSISEDRYGDEGFVRGG